jgi:hypothetical protein
MFSFEFLHLRYNEQSLMLLPLISSDIHASFMPIHKTFINKHLMGAHLGLLVRRKRRLLPNHRKSLKKKGF